MDDSANGKGGKRMENLADATRWKVNEGDVACEVRIRDVLGPCANSASPTLYVCIVSSRFDFHVPMCSFCLSHTDIKGVQIRDVPTPRTTHT